MSEKVGALTEKISDYFFASFFQVYHTLDVPGFVSAMPFKADQLNVKNQRLAVAKEIACGLIKIEEKMTSPPEYLKEGELV